ncbi:hypothetical protein BDV18DRAFT_130863 [Aspergillus unguis]
MFRSLLSPRYGYGVTRRSFASTTDADLTAAREWLSQFNSTPLPRHIGEISFSRSGGPGGQNVNKSVPDPRTGSYIPAWSIPRRH